MLTESEYKDYTEYNMRHVYRYVSGKSQLLVSIDGLDLDDPKIKLSLQRYDKDAPSGRRVSSSLTFYIPVPVVLRFCHDVVHGVYFNKKIRYQKANAAKNPPYFSHSGGEEENGKITCLHLSLVDETYGKSNFAFVGSAGVGERNLDNGSIHLRKGTKPFTTIYIPIPDDDIKEMALVVEAYMKAFIQIDMEKRLSSVREQRERYARRHGNGRD